MAQRRMTRACRCRRHGPKITHTQPTRAASSSAINTSSGAIFNTRIPAKLEDLTEQPGEFLVPLFCGLDTKHIHVHADLGGEPCQFTLPFRWHQGSSFGL